MIFCFIGWHQFPSNKAQMIEFECQCCKRTFYHGESEWQPADLFLILIILTIMSMAIGLKVVI